MSSRSTSLTVALILFLSGFASLVYEILWVRYFSYLIGGTVISLSLVSAVFLGGLAIGYRYLGRLGDKQERPLRLYVRLEVGIALFSLLPLSIHGFLPQLVDPLFLVLAETPPLLYTFQFLLTCLLILPCTICMGGTVPVMLGAFRDTPLAPALARYYFINTLGGAAGVLATVFLLLPQLGAYYNHLLAFCLSLASGGVAALVEKEHAPVSIAGEEKEKGKIAPALAGLTFFCGFFILACEILWSRLLMLYLGNTIYAFGIILGIVLLAIAAGSLIFPLLPQRLVHSWRFAAGLLLVMTLSVGVPALYYDQAAQLFYRANLQAGSSWGLLITLQMATVLLLIGIPTFCSGLFFPLIAGLCTTGSGTRSRTAGQIGFWNPTGTILGSLVPSFWVLPALELRDGFLLLSVLVFVAGLAICLFRIGRDNRTAALRWGIGLALFWILPVIFSRSWDQKMIHSGLYLYTPYYQELGSLRKGLGQSRLLFSKHDRESSVAINENRMGERFMTINGKVDAGSGQDMATQYLLAHLPMLHHPDPQKVMVIGLGSGITVGSAALYPSTQIDCLEISPAVVEASDFFKKENRNALADPRVRLRVADGMYYLRTEGETYDVIVSEPSNPWQQGNASLFSRDFYRQVRNRLAPDGIFCQWIPLYDLSPRHLKTALATFKESFSDSLLFLNSGDLLVIGANTPITQPSPFTQVPTAVSQQLAHINITGVGDLYADKFLYTGDNLTSALSGIESNTLNRSALEFAAKPLFTSGLVGPYRKTNTDWLLSFK
ncbi:MAG: hypothetical protein C0614_06590 [Desulfuromonas sp.]|nr:MAG: hypothetical protein C0614_06590 [Desulfuromonas sp.]